jgi:hypothetical protein
MAPGLHDRRSAVMATLSALDPRARRSVRHRNLRVSTETRRRALEAAYIDIVTDDLPEWNQDPGLLNWLADL